MATTWSTSFAGGARLFLGSLSLCQKILKRHSSSLKKGFALRFREINLDWKRKSDDDPTKIFEALRTAMKNIIEDARRDKVRDEDLRGLSRYTGGRGRNHPPAYAAGLEDSNAPPRAETPAPNGGGNGRGRSRARRAQRSASPGVRSTASNDTK